MLMTRLLYVSPCQSSACQGVELDRTPGHHHRHDSTYSNVTSMPVYIDTSTDKDLVMLP